MALDLARFPKLARNLSRVAEIVRVLGRYGLADWVARVDARFVRRLLKRTAIAPLTDVSHEARIRLALTDLGTTFIKFGQMLSTRRDLIGPELASELTKLQSDVPADPFAVTQTTVEFELKKPLHELFATFDETPMASASIGQCHGATLPDGRRVVVKVQHPDIAGRIHSDLAILSELARLAEEYITELQPYRPVAVVSEFQRVLLRELDFRRELRHLQLFNRYFAKDEGVKFPVPLPELSTSRVLTMERLDGCPLTKVKDFALIGSDANELARRGARVFLDMIFRDGFYHADPHPGNILVMADGVIGLLDAGMVGRVDDRLRSQIERGLAAVMAQDADALTELIIQVGDAPPGFEPTELRLEVADQLAFYWGMPLDQFQVGVALDEMTEAIRRYRIALPPPLALLLKTLVMLEGTARLVNPTFNLVEVLRPYRRQFWMRRMSPRRLARRAWTSFQDWEDLVLSAPRQLRDLIRGVQHHRFAIQLEHHHLEPSVNRMVFGLMTSSLFVGSALMWSYKAPPTIADVSVFGVLGCLTSAVLAARLTWAIQKSGKLEDRE
jgi:ubiquinone biosynthesis protein